MISSTTCHQRATDHGRVRFEATQHDASQQHTEEESPSLWRTVRDDHGRRLICPRTACADKVRTTGPQDFKSACQITILFCCLNFYFARNIQVSKEQELGLENRKRKFDIREEYFASLDFPHYFAPISPIYLPSASRNSAQRPPEIGSPNVSNVQSEHRNGAYHPPNPH